MKPAQLRSRVIAEWRGLPEKGAAPDRTVAIADAVTKLIQSLGLQDRLRAEVILGAWREIVGDFVAQHSAPRQIKDGVLHVSCLQPTLRFELDRVWKREILDKLKARFGPRAVKDIKFGMG